MIGLKKQYIGSFQEFSPSSGCFSFFVSAGALCLFCPSVLDGIAVQAIP